MIRGRYQETYQYDPWIYIGKRESVNRIINVAKSDDQEMFQRTGVSLLLTAYVPLEMRINQGSLKTRDRYVPPFRPKVSERELPLVSELFF